MKLRNRKTGQIGNFIINKDHFECADLDYVPEYGSLAELNEEWEDYEDELFYIISAEHKDGYTVALKDEWKELCNVAKELGLGFETEKEAKKAVEKLRAWKRLKDKGFRFIPEASYVEEQPKETGESMMLIACTMNDDKDFIYGDNKDLKLLFLGEDDQWT